MNRHIVVLAEERATIESLLKRAVTDKPDSENLETLQVAKTEDELWSHLQDSVSILLLSSTFSTKPNNELIEEILEKFPAIRIISLSHRYGDRSSLKAGAFAVIDKPVRNPVLWAKIDDAILEIESDWESEETIIPLLDEEKHENNEENSEKYEHSFHVKQKEEDEIVFEEEIDETVELLIEDDKEEDVKDVKSTIPVYQPSTPVSFERNESSGLIIDDGDEEDEEDDLFGDTPSNPYKRPSLPLEKNVDVEREEDDTISFEVDDSSDAFSLIEDEEDDVKDVSSHTGYESISDDEQDVPLYNLEDDEPKAPLYEDKETSHTSLEESNGSNTEFFIEEEETEVEEADETSHVLIEEEPTIHQEDVKEDEPQVELIQPVNDIPIRPVRKVVKRASNDLEHKKEIMGESQVYDEKSEWTKADEGFTARNGEFVSLVPPRPEGRKSVSGGKTQAKAESPGESVGLFGTVRSLFKK